MKTWLTPWNAAQLALFGGAVAVLALGPRNMAWNQVGWIALSSSFAVGWAQASFDPKSSLPDKVVPRTVLLLALICIAISISRT